MGRRDLKTWQRFELPSFPEYIPVQGTDNNMHVNPTTVTLHTCRNKQTVLQKIQKGVFTHSSQTYQTIKKSSDPPQKLNWYSRNKSIISTIIQSDVLSFRNYSKRISGKLSLFWDSCFAVTHFLKSNVNWFLIKKHFFLFEIPKGKANELATRRCKQSP